MLSLFSSGDFAIKKEQGPNWGLGEGMVLNAEVNVHICYVHATGVFTDTQILLLKWSPYQYLCPLLRPSTKLVNFTHYIFQIQHFQLLSLLSMPVAASCFLISFISEIIMLTSMSNYLAHSCLAYKLFMYHSSSVELSSLHVSLFFPLSSYSLEAHMYLPLKGQMS